MQCSFQGPGPQKVHDQKVLYTVYVSYVACFICVYIVVGAQDVLELHPVMLTCSHGVLVAIVWFWNQGLVLQVIFFGFPMMRMDESLWQSGSWNPNCMILH